MEGGESVLQACKTAVLAGSEQAGVPVPAAVIAGALTAAATVIVDSPRDASEVPLVASCCNVVSMAHQCGDLSLTFRAKSIEQSMPPQLCCVIM